ncbi:M15 family metallopeptidase [Oceanobacillus manasiensis]|uniref:M15 family metallopeptidase n=1 Tax=Oceanobacillus manasiensis TaxID=586413 RepID=UPI0005A77152|nr:M15 family metallopeptidase [Oceanobacillus manasiensis]
MRHIYSTLSTWLIIILFLVLLFILYNQQNSNYEDKGTDASMPTDLHPIVEEKKNKLIEEAKEIDIDIVITETVRTFDEQADLYEQGRTTEGNIVTYAQGGESYHNYGLAIDYALSDKNGNIVWDINYDGNENGESDWFEVADIAKKLGFEWGGDWESFKDYPHLQMTFGLSIRDLQNGLRPKEDLEVEEVDNK